MVLRIQDPFADDLVPLLRQLVSIDSVNPSLVPGGAGEGTLARFVASWFRQRGVDATLEEVAGTGRPNVIAIADAGRPGRTIMLNAHMDTVGVAAMMQPFSASVEGGRLFGRGAMDTKGGLAAFMVATAAAATNRLDGKVIFTAVADEEFASLGTESLVGRYQADAAIVAEPTGMEIITSHKGFVWLDIETIGVAAHGSKFEEGVDAIAMMGKFLGKLAELNRQLQAQPHPVLGPASVHASLIKGGQELSSYPASCTLSIERRTLPGESSEMVRAEIQGLIDRLSAADPQFRATCKTTFSREPLEVYSQSDIVDSLARQFRDLLGRDPAISGLSGWTDAALLTAAGIPSIVFGPSGEGLHGGREWVDLESVAQCCAVVLATVTDFTKRQ